MGREDRSMDISKDIRIQVSIGQDDHFRNAAYAISIWLQGHLQQNQIQVYGERGGHNVGFMKMFVLPGRAKHAIRQIDEELAATID